MTKAVREHRPQNQISVAVPPDLRARLESAAAADRRSISNFARNILETALQPRKGVAQ
jgi:hypothetical protein